MTFTETKPGHALCVALMYAKAALGWLLVLSVFLVFELIPRLWREPWAPTEGPRGH